MRLPLIAPLLVAPLPVAAIEASNVRTGLICSGTPSPRGDSGGWVCQPTTTEVLVTGQGRYTFDGRRLPCTWVGVEFDYRGARDGQALQCTSQTSEPVTDGNPGGIAGENVGSTSYGITLDPGDGHYFPQYILYRMHDSVDGEDMRQATPCSADGRVLFEREFVFRAAALSRGSGPAALAPRLVPADSSTRLSAVATQRSVPVSAAPLPARVAPPMRSVRGASGCRS